MNRELVKKIYKSRRQKDGVQIGRRINLLTQTLVLQSKLPREQRDGDLIKETAVELKNLRSEPRFRDEFPSFEKFWNFIKETNLATYKENKELLATEQKPYITINDLLD